MNVAASLLLFLACAIPAAVWLHAPHFLPLAIAFGSGTCLAAFGSIIIKAIQEYRVCIVREKTSEALEIIASAGVLHLRNGDLQAARRRQTAGRT
ncbi:MAG: hypothetical protein HY474_01080 [Candidatus Sungbacteria bacterium]|uniref:Uncharacterized protein n=1 Tax=Candidatus Sungiibacteriota bacterium TaxID=2750080 RepID=A0A932YXU4_9BACT|nr:hypothetical protein [Candidatus Sungbacteria bacterium]